MLALPVVTALGTGRELCLAKGASLGKGAPAHPQQLMVQWESLAMVSNVKVTAGGLGWASGRAQQGGDVSVPLPADHQLFAMSLGVPWGSQG